MKTLIITLTCIFLGTGAFAQNTNEERYAKVKKPKMMKIGKSAYNSRSNPPDMVVLRREAKPTKMKSNRFQNADRTPFAGRMEKTKR